MPTNTPVNPRVHDRPFISANQLAIRVSVSHTTISRWIEQGYIRASRLKGSRGRWEISRLEAARIEQEFHSQLSLLECLTR
jgi:predicted site-specific integrase-resolvase